MSTLSISHAARLTTISLIVLTSVLSPGGAQDLGQSKTDADANTLRQQTAGVLQRLDAAPRQQPNSPAKPQLPHTKMTDFSVIFPQIDDDQTTDAPSNRGSDDLR
jgi:hypothetical protein